MRQSNPVRTDRTDRMRLAGRLRGLRALAAVLPIPLAACAAPAPAPTMPVLVDATEVRSDLTGAAPTMAVIDDPTSLPEPPDPGGTQRLLATCRDLHAALAEAVGLRQDDLQLRPSDVPNPAWGNILDGCRLSWAGPGARLAFGASAMDMPSFKAQSALLRAGWEADEDLSEDQPGRFVRGFTQGNTLCLLELRLRPPAGRPCLADDPVTCGLGPAELDYDIGLSCADY